MTQLEIAQQLRKQIADNWPFVKEILALHENNTEGQFNEHIKDRVNKLLSNEVFYQEVSFNNVDITITLLENYGSKFNPINSMPIYQVLFATEEKPLGNYY